MATASSWQKENISLAYVAAVATLSGCTVGSWSTDKDGVDATLRRGAIMVDLQMKCSHAARLVGDSYVYDLDIPTYDKLRDPYRSAPGYLGLVIVPEDLDEWMLHDEAELLLRCAGYYAAIQDRGAAKGATTTAIHLPKAQRFDIAAIDAMLQHSMHRVTHGAVAGEVA